MSSVQGQWGKGTYLAPQGITTSPENMIGLWGTQEQKENREGRDVGPETFVDW